MDVKNMNIGPKVRIGVIQKTDTVELSCSTSAKLETPDGTVVGSLTAGQKINFNSKNPIPAEMRWGVRVARIPQKPEAEELLARLKSEKNSAEILYVGEVIEMADYTMDNREYWVVVNGFCCQDTAKAAVEKFMAYEDQTPIAIPVKAPAGEIKFGDTITGPAVRVVPDNMAGSKITVENVRVGIEFHWDHLEAQDYWGVIEIRINNTGEFEVINELCVEDYLVSVNSSEMTSDCPVDLLKSQTIAARSTIFATMGKHHFGQAFHICADDHCQCYRGTRYVQATSFNAVKSCLGEGLLFDNKVCDARYAKICGGVMESYEFVWENRAVPYMVCGIDGEFEIDYPLDTEEKARAYIDSSPDAYCNTDKYKLPKMLEFSNHLFRWRLEHTREELEEIIHDRSGEDIGELIDIVPLQRGPSARLVYINIVGSKKTIRVGKELAIRRTLSKTHVYSSCFYVEKEEKDGHAVKFTLVGAGWGHGVGLCQVGATIMAQKGFDYKQILAHYYKNSKLVKLY
ncbi:SpoIID/LytB domain-containing protein [bacterium]|nr:SpoIID/LytB domain-containing protein [bacterium]